MIALVASAFAAVPASIPREDPPRSTLAVGLRGAAERWSDPAIGQVYKSGSWFGGIGVVGRFGPLLGVDAEATFARLDGEGTTLELAPLSLLGEVRCPFGASEGFVGLGPTWTSFVEKASEGRVVTGARLAGELRLGLRVDTGLVHPPMPPADGGPVRKVEFEFAVGRRSELPSSAPGFALGAWRGTVGLLSSF